MTEAGLLNLESATALLPAGTFAILEEKPIFLGGAATVAALDGRGLCTPLRVGL